MEFKLPGFKNKKDVTDSSVSFEEKNIALQERMNRIYKFGGIGGMLIGGLSLLALNAALPLKTTVVDAYLIDKVTGVAERLTSVKKENLSEKARITIRLSYILSDRNLHLMYPELLDICFVRYMWLFHFYHIFFS